MHSSSGSVILGMWMYPSRPLPRAVTHAADEKEGAVSGTHDISFYCDDIHTTVADLKAKGVIFTDAIQDHGYGLVTHFMMPGDFAVQLYQPRYRKNPR